MADPEYKVATSVPWGDPCNAEDVFGYMPSSSYSPGERITDLSGLQPFVGYPRSKWKFQSIHRDKLAAFFTLIGNVYSAQCYVRTRDTFDTWADYRAIVIIPDPAGLERWGEHYKDVVLEFILLEAV